MFKPFFFLGLTLAALLAFPLVSRAGTNGPLVQRTYEVADLVIPVVDQSIADFFLMPEVAEKPFPSKPQLAPRRKKEATASRPAEHSHPTLENRLIRMILQEIEPCSWSENGGAATVGYYPLGHALVVNQTAENHERINELLAAMRRLQDVKVAVEIRLVSVPEDLYPRLMKAANLATGVAPCSVSECKSAGQIRSSSGRKLGYLKERQVVQLLEAAQRDRRTNIMQTPKLTMFNRQTSVISVTDQQLFATGLKPVPTSTATGYALVPVNQPFELGAKFALKPAVSADRRSVRLDVMVNLANLASENVPLLSVTTLVKPEPARGVQGEPLPLTQSIQMPQFERQTLDTQVVIADGDTVVFGGWKRSREVREVLPNGFLEGTPILELVVGLLEELPAAETLLGSMSYHRESECLMMLVTPRIIVAEEVEERAAARPMP